MTESEKPSLFSSQKKSKVQLPGFKSTGGEKTDVLQPSDITKSPSNQAFPQMASQAPAMQIRHATFLSRLLALLIDCAVVFPIYLIAGLMILLFSNPYYYQAVFETIVLISASILAGFYFVYTESVKGQTIGKRVMKIQVLRVDGAHCSFFRSFLRNLSGVLDVLLWPVSILMVIYTAKKQRIGDVFAKTVVVMKL